MPQIRIHSAIETVLGPHIAAPVGHSEIHPGNGRTDFTERFISVAVMENNALKFIDSFVVMLDITDHFAFFSFVYHDAALIKLSAEIKIDTDSETEHTHRRQRKLDCLCALMTARKISKRFRLQNYFIFAENVPLRLVDPYQVVRIDSAHTWLLVSVLYNIFKLVTNIHIDVLIACVIQRILNRTCLIANILLDHTAFDK